MGTEIIGVIARMDWENTLILLPAMGRSAKNSRLVQDIEFPGQLGEGFLQQVVDMVFVHGAVEIFVIGSSNNQTAQDILDRVNSLLESGKMPASVPIHGLLFNPDDYRLELVCKGYEDNLRVSK